MECLKSISEVKISSDNKYVFNGEQSYDSNRKYGLGIGKYQIRNIPNEHPMAILNNDCSDNIIYYGNDKVTLTGNAGISLQNDDGYSFYTGTIHIIVKGDFQKDGSGLSIYCGEHGYMGGENLLQYSETCRNFHKIDNSISSVTKAIKDVDVKSGTIDVLKSCVNSLQIMKRKIKNQKLDLESNLNNALAYETGSNADLTENELLSVGVISNVNTTTNGNGARRKYEGGGGVAIINNKKQFDGSGNEIIGGARFSKKMIDDFLDSLIDNLEKFNGEKKYDTKIQNESKIDISVNAIDSENIDIIFDATDDTTENLKNGDIVYIDNNDKLNGQYVVDKEKGTNSGQSGSDTTIKLKFIKKQNKNIYDIEGNKSNFKTGDTGKLKLKFNKINSDSSGRAGKFNMTF